MVIIKTIKEITGKTINLNTHRIIIQIKSITKTQITIHNQINTINNSHNKPNLFNNKLMHYLHPTL